MKKYLLFGIAAGLLSTGGQAQVPIQKVVLEKFTGAWAPYCPDATVIAEQINHDYVNAIVYDIHNGDAMEVTEGAELSAFYGCFFPLGQINRSGVPANRQDWNRMVADALQDEPLAAVSIDNLTYDAGSRQLELDVKATFFGPASGDMRLNLAIFEDHVTGIGHGYDQMNYYTDTIGHPFYLAGNPVVGFEHRRVLRAMLSGAWGGTGMIPGNVNSGSSFTKHYSYVLPSGWDASEIGMAALLQRYDGIDMDDRKIINAEEFYLNSMLVSNSPVLNRETPGMSIAPNPSSGFCRVDFSLKTSGQIRMEVFNATGQHVATLGEGVMNVGLHTLNWNGTDAQGNPVGNGIYMVRLLTKGGHSTTQRVMISR